MRKIVYMFACIVFSCYFSCGGTTASNVPTQGSNINSAWEVSDLTCAGTWTGGYTSFGTARVTIASGTLTSCANVKTTTPPTVTELQTLPAGFTIDTAAGYTNITQYNQNIYTVAYQFTLNGNAFVMNTINNVTITLPYNQSKAATTDSTKLFIRIFNQDDNSVVDLNGDTSTAGLVTAKVYGLPSQFTAVVIYNAHMDTSRSANATGGTAWNAQAWCVVYNSASTEVINATKTILGITTAPTSQQIKDVIKTYVGDETASVQGSYQTAGFTSPQLYETTSTSDPCSSSTLYVMYLDEAGANFSSSDPNEVITPAGNKYGRVYISPTRILSASTDADGSITAAIGDELMNSIENAYQMHSGLTTQGYQDGASMVYGTTLDQGTISVSSYSSSYTEYMSDFVTVNKRGSDTAVAFSNQDFFAYVGKQYNSNSMAYLSGMFNQISSDITGLSGDAKKLQPPRSTVNDSMNQYFTNNLSHSLRDIYLDFLLQRSLAHNANSQFGRSGETITGFASNLFEISAADSTRNSVAQITVDPTTCALSSSSGGFGNVAPLAARAIWITPSTTLAGGRTITVTLTFASGGIGGNWGGSTYQSGTTGTLAATNTFAAFGTATNDEIVLVIGNTTYNLLTYFNYTVTCS